MNKLVNTELKKLLKKSVISVVICIGFGSTIITHHHWVIALTLRWLRSSDTGLLLMHFTKLLMYSFSFELGYHLPKRFLHFNQVHKWLICNLPCPLGPQEVD